MGLTNILIHYALHVVEIKELISQLNRFLANIHPVGQLLLVYIQHLLNFASKTLCNNVRAETDSQKFNARIVCKYVFDEVFHNVHPCKRLRF